jgi:hypothetical protein
MILGVVDRHHLTAQPADAVAALEAVGKAISASAVSIGPETMFDLGFSHGIGLAALLRALLDPAGFDGVLQVSDLAWRGVLAVLSLRYRRAPFRQIRLPDGSVGRLLQTDPFRYTLAVSDGVPVFFRAFDPCALRPLSRPFETVELPTIGPVSPAFVARVVQSVSKDGFLAEPALAELSFENPIPADVVSRIGASETAADPDRLLPLSTADSVCFKATAGLVCTLGPPDNSDSVALEITAEAVRVGPKHLTFALTGDIIRITLIGPARRLALQRGDLFMLTDVRLGHLREPHLYVGRAKPELFGPEVLPFPTLLKRSISSRLHRFSHVLGDNRLQLIRQWNRIGLTTPVHLFPPIVPAGVVYAEFAVAVKTELAIVNGIDLTAVLYEFEVGIGEARRATVGLGFDSETGAAFVTRNGVCILESVMRLPEGFEGLVFRTATPAGFVNTGEIPFVCERLPEIVQGFGSEVREFGKTWETAGIGRGPGMAGASPSDLTKMWPPVIPTNSELRPAMLTARDGRMIPGFVSKGNFTPQGDTLGLMALSEKVRSPFDRMPVIPRALGEWRAMLPEGFGDELRPPVRLSSAIDRLAKRAQLSAIANVRAREAITPDIHELIERIGTGLSDERTFSGHVAPEFSNLVNHLRIGNESLFEELANQASVILRQKRAKSLLSAIGSVEPDEYNLGKTDAVWLGLGTLSQPIEVSIDRLSSIHLRNPSAQITARGGYFKLRGEGLHLLYTFPIMLSEGNLGFAIHFVNYLLKVASSDQLSRHLLSQRILLPILSDIQNGEFVLLTETYGRWFTTIVEQQLFEPNEFVPFVKILNFQSLKRISCPYLATGVTLFSALAFSSVNPDPLIVRDHISEFINAIADSSDSLASRITRQIAVDLLNPYGNQLSILGAVGSLPLPVLTSVSHLCYHAMPPPIKIEPGSLAPPNFSQRIEVPEALGYTVTLSRPHDTFMRINDRLCSAVSTEVDLPAFRLTILSGDPSLPSVLIVPHVRPTSISPLDSAAVVAAHAALAKKLTPATDALLFATAQMAPAGEIPDSALIKLAPALPLSAARFRVNVHRLLMGEAVELLHFSQARWLAPVHAQPRRRTAGVFEVPETAALPDITGFFAMVSQMHSIAPFDRAPFPKLLGKGRPSAELAGCWDRLFVTPRGGKWLLPRAEAEREAMVGFGQWLAWIWRAGKPLPLPLSRVVIRAAFGGRVRADDCEDGSGSGDEIEELVRPITGQLAAIRAGVLAAGIVVDDDPLLPRVFQLRPFVVAHGAKKRASVFTTPLVRERVWTEQVRVRNAATFAASLDEIIGQMK